MDFDKIKQNILNSSETSTSESESISGSELHEEFEINNFLPEFEPLKLSGKNLAQQYVSAFNTPLEYKKDAADIDFPAGYKVTVAVAPEAALGPAGAQIAPADATPANLNALRITVAVTYGGNQAITLVGYRTRYAPNLI